MNKVYRSPYEAYPFLADESSDLRCDFEILTDKLCSGTGYLCAMMKEKGYVELVQPLRLIGELIYHANPSLRTSCKITREEVDWLKKEVDSLNEQIKCSGFVLPQGGMEACYSHVLRTEGKELVRLLYRYIYQGHEVSELLIDFCNLLSGYYFLLSLYLNEKQGVEEIPFISRNYK